jgi:hypothetical protein
MGREGDPAPDAFTAGLLRLDTAQMSIADALYVQRSASNPTRDPKSIHGHRHRRALASGTPKSEP